MIIKNLSLVYLVYITRAGTFLILIPYMAYVLSPEKWGMVAMLISFMQLGITALEFGFGISGTKSVADIQGQISLLSEYLVNVFIIQIFIFFVISMVAYLLYQMAYIYTVEILILLLISILLQGMIPLWFLRGVEDLLHVSVSEATGKLSILVIVYFLVEDDLDSVNIFRAFLVGSLLPFIFSLWVVRKYIHIRNFLISVSRIKSIFLESFPFFIMRFGAILVTSGNSFFLGLFNHTVAAGYFAIVEKLVNGVKNLMLPAWEVIFPRLIRLFQQDHQKAIKFKKHAYIAMIGFAIFISLVLLIGAELFMSFFVSEDNLQDSVLNLQILSFVPFFSAIGNAFGMNYLVIKNKSKQFVLSVLFGGLINLGLLIVLLYIDVIKAVNAACFSAITGYIFMATFIFYFARNVALNDKN